MKTQDREGTNISRTTDNNEKVTLIEKKVKWWLTFSNQTQSRSLSGFIVPANQSITSEFTQFTTSFHTFQRSWISTHIHLTLKALSFSHNWPKRNMHDREYERSKHKCAMMTIRTNTQVCAEPHH